MNLVNDQWIPIIRASGATETIAPWQVVEGIESDPIIDFDGLRPDFQNAYSVR